MKKSKPCALIACDPHATKDNYEEVYQILLEGLEFCVTYGITHFIIAGDLFSSRTGQPRAVLQMVYNLREKAMELGILISAIAGNHDKQDLDAPESFLDVFHLPNAFHVTQHVGVVQAGLRKLILLPYFKENGMYPIYLEEAAKAAKAFKATGEGVDLITHIAVNTVRNNDGSQVENELSENLFAAFDNVFVGHYHNASVIGNIIYPGSTHPQNWGEDNEKGFTLLYEDGTYERIQPRFRHYLKFELTPEEITPKRMLELGAWVASSHVRVVLKGERAVLQTIDKGQFTKIGVAVKTESTEIVQAIAAAERSEVVLFTQTDIADEFKAFCNTRQLKQSQYAIGSAYLKAIL